ncbi:hypothetical protein [Peribacillus sp. SCS-155]|uniref:hypothetical protein n=1 Tax=Peribacillus sedimenti TaxID=3115297 RepID=UPI0039060356
MAGYIFDLIVAAGLIIGITALNGIITNGIGEKFFGGKQHSDISDHSSRIQEGWNEVGGKKS